MLNTADLEQPSQAIGDYVKAGRLLVDDAAYIGLLYSKRAMLIRPYVKGVGFNAIYDYPLVRDKDPPTLIGGDHREARLPT